jgi:hypothetical protein
MLKDKNNLRAGFWYLLCENISFHKSCHFLDIYSWWEILMEIQRQRLIRVPWLWFSIHPFDREYTNIL